MNERTSEHITPPFSEAIGFIGTLTTPQLSILKDKLSSTIAIDPNLEAQNLSHQLEIDLIRVRYLLYGLRALTNSLNIEDKAYLSKAAFSDAVHSLSLKLDRVDHAFPDATIDALYSTLIDNSELFNFREAFFVKQGFLDEAYDFHSLVEMRPVYDRDQANIIDFVTVAQLQILLRTNSNNSSPVVLQLDDQSISKLKDAIGVLDRKMLLSSLQIERFKRSFASDE